jgi:hypothetical protein
MDGKRITIYEASNIAGGCLDGIKHPKEELNLDKEPNPFRYMSHDLSVIFNALVQ